MSSSKPSRKPLSPSALSRGDFDSGEKSRSCLESERTRSTLNPHVIETHGDVFSILLMQHSRSLQEFRNQDGGSKEETGRSLRGSLSEDDAWTQTNERMSNTSRDGNRKFQPSSIILTHKGMPSKYSTKGGDYRTLRESLGLSWISKLVSDIHPALAPMASSLVEDILDKDTPLSLHAVGERLVHELHHRIEDPKESYIDACGRIVMRVVCERLCEEDEEGYPLGEGGS